MKVKKTKLPENLYHYTSLIKYRMILATGKLLLTPSNLKYDNAHSMTNHSFLMGRKLVINLLTNMKTITLSSG